MTSDCQHVAQLLPWLLNGTLDAAEERQVRAHLAGCAACREELRRTRQAWDLHAGHLPAEALVDYALDRVTGPEQRQLIAQHLAGCSRCQAELDLIAVAEPEELPRPFPAPVVPLRRPGTGAPQLAIWRGLALAASLVAVVNGVGWLRSWQRLAPAAVAPPPIAVTPTPGGDQPRLNPPVIELLPASAETVPRGAVPEEGAVVNHLAAAGGEVTFVLLAAEPGPATPFALEILDERGQVLWRGDGLLANRDGHFTLTVPATLLPAGRWTLRVSRREDGQHVRLYQVHVAAPQ